MSSPAGTYVGQVERDPQGVLWAVLYYRDQVVTRESARSFRKAKRRVADLVLSAAENYPCGPVPARAPAPRAFAARAIAEPRGPISQPRAALAHLA